ncbi:hypothetical protein KZP23_17225 [Echinicola marina]|uniref:hypothetical protein n=1 Tax=Echinicola marina TaxID=2859768 RepID=UPI001CF6BB51|nr:hypothetical protein [Echinicola marina]UCS92424.1 hypothetical protein KZP23_17225 [Echinicola marina]
MDQENLDYLKEKLKYTGFDTDLNSALEKNIKANMEAFNLPHSMEIDGRKMDFNLHFRKSNTSERYFLNKYDASLHNANPEIAPKDHTFYNNQSITAKEAFNLLEGRAVKKGMLNAEKEPYQAWVQLDFTEKDKNNNFKIDSYHENYGYDSKEALAKLPIKELQDPTKSEWMIKAFEKGNVYPVTMEKGGKEEIMYVSANPKFKSVNVMDAEMKMVKTKDLLISKEQGKEVKEGQQAKKTQAPEMKNVPKEPKKGKGARV